MARKFVTASTQYLSHAAAVVTVPPFTMGCWAYIEADVNHALMAIGDTASDSRLHLLYVTNGGFQCRVQSSDSGYDSAADAVSAAASLNTWHHFCGVWTATNSRAAFLDGGNKGTNVQNENVTVFNRTAIGARVGASVLFPASARIAHAAIWNVALTDSEVLSLGQGFSPLFIRPSALKAYWMLDGDNSPEPDRWGNVGYAMTLTNAPTQVDGPRIYMPE